MASVSMDRWIPAPPAEVEPLVTDVPAFMAAGRFDEVRVQGDTLVLANVFGFARIELTLELIDDPDTVLAYEQAEGIFEEMTTRYTLTQEADGTRIEATTEFRLGGVAGSVLDATVIKRQRRRELTAQFDYLEAEAGGG